MSENVRVRFAPSPTGSLHIGGARTALFNLLFARHNNGTFVLRIEDTDTERSTEESTQQILRSLKWLGLDWDEGPEKGGNFGPYFQSQRLELYKKEVDRLLAEGKAYYCYCSPEELSERREAALKAGKPPKYDGRCRNLTPEQRKKFEDEGRPYTIRLKMPEEGQTVVEDLIRGTVVFDNSVLDDLIIVKSNGIPTYNFACVVDDNAMKMTHIIRAEEHLSNTPKQIQTYLALGYEIPKFAHVPMILAPDRSKLSKRHGATSVEEFRDQGYLAESIINYLTLLGWSPEGTEEIFDMDKAIREFTLERVNKTAAIYDVKKLTWINGHYMRELDLEYITEQTIPFMIKKGIVTEEEARDNFDYIKKVVEISRDRAKTLDELADTIAFFFKDVTEYEEKGVKKHFSKENAAKLLTLGAEALEKLEDFTHDKTEETFRNITADMGLKAAEIIHPTRLAITGRTVGPGLFDIIVLLGREKTVERMRKAAQWISNKSN
ncbi:MAG: glutamate--tRNA ligase [Tepidanaerobacter acetatoxydans]|uniref:Glutamate--tRNA ligase n=1 Tax=Tepidanaerobacter acetatoxydans (strain DSM 21804 / JCM 16047 / Re1) TaxID=1209989 RepID=F4LWU9_TEPAE|nr:glutamate--tRNA ligase [Tepidanaerobacter acetatoxydans]AEE91821.1 glutamyl-tRNA synthetase [Tepidanaerobacter acetatoxydans Re1]NLU09332.1 glutamate--tRNA ligase [Tepidanaerobacter acetatoxydans]CDI40821.1 Glutamate--tRNA ligase [Tepidanaerobacter acetatoxydans Re1]